MIGFEDKLWLLGLITLVPLVFLFLSVLKWKQRTKKALGDEQLIGRLIQNYSPNRYRNKFIITLLAIALCIIAAANLRMPRASGTEKTAGIDVIFALDVSKSMLANDLKPNRLERARQLISLMMDGLENNRVGLILFAGTPFLQMPLTPDFSQAKMYLANANPDAITVQGTDLSAALALCNSSLDTKEKKHKAVVLITDGEDHEGGAISEAGKLADNGVVVYTIGIGSKEGSYIPDPVLGGFKTDRNGKTVISKLNSAELQQIASATNGQYFHLENPLTTAKEINGSLNKMEKKLIEGKGGSKIYFYFLPLIVAVVLVLLVIEIFIPETGKSLKENRQGYNEKILRS